jgi:hypothetical protein
MHKSSTDEDCGHTQARNNGSADVILEYEGDTEEEGIYKC